MVKEESATGWDGVEREGDGEGGVAVPGVVSGASGVAGAVSEEALSV